jgi:hypothetical protein
MKLTQSLLNNFNISYGIIITMGKRMDKRHRLKKTRVEIFANLMCQIFKTLPSCVKIVF